MPYKSEAQRRFFHTETARQKGITKAMVKKWDKEAEESAIATFSGLKQPKDLSVDTKNNTLAYKGIGQEESLKTTNYGPDMKLQNASQNNLPVTRNG